MRRTKLKNVDDAKRCGHSAGAGQGGGGVGELRDIAGGKMRKKGVAWRENDAVDV